MNGEGQSQWRGMDCRVDPHFVAIAAVSGNVTYDQKNSLRLSEITRINRIDRLDGWIAPV